MSSFSLHSWWWWWYRGQEEISEGQNVWMFKHWKEVLTRAAAGEEGVEEDVPVETEGEEEEEEEEEKEW